MSSTTSLSSAGSPPSSKSKLLTSDLMKYHSKQVIRKMRSQMRKLVTGDEKKRVRDLIKEAKNEPTNIKLFDKLCFTGGVLNIIGCQHYAFTEPELYWAWYTLTIALLMLMRIPAFVMTNLQYFLFDFCYFVQLLTFIQMYVTSVAGNETFFRVLYIYTTGPLMWAVVLWRNSLVFHDYEKMSSVYIHILPAGLYYTLRWHTNFTNASPITYIDFGCAILGYIFWQFCYYFKTEVADKKLLDSNPNMLTSLRWMTGETKSVVSLAALKFCRHIGLYGSEEKFNSTSFKTKFVFMFFQLSYTILAMLLVPLFYNNKIANWVFISFIFTTAVYQGASFYIEVFSARYQLKFSKNNSNIQDVAQAATEVTIKVMRALSESGGMNKTANDDVDVGGDSDSKKTVRRDSGNNKDDDDDGVGLSLDDADREALGVDSLARIATKAVVDSFCDQDENSLNGSDDEYDRSSRIDSKDE